MIICRRLAAGELGTKKLFKEYGERLVCVRYRYDSDKHEKMKTVEIVVEKKPWNRKLEKIRGNKNVHLRIEYHELELRRVVKAAGGRWNKEEKVWELPYLDVMALGLKKRILKQ